MTKLMMDPNITFEFAWIIFAFLVTLGLILFNAKKMSKNRNTYPHEWNEKPGFGANQQGRGQLPARFC